MNQPGRKTARAAGALLLALLLLGCAKAPVGSALFGSSLERQGRELAAELERNGMLLRDPVLTAYVRKIGERVADEVEDSPVAKYSFHILDAQEPNAFALPSGHIYISRGLLALLNSEDELAGIMGHEVGHVVGRHHVKRVSRDIPLLPIRVIFKLTGAIVGLVLPPVGNAVSASGDLTSALVHAPYGRGQETEADEIGQQLAASAGWDPEGISRVMDQLAAEQALHGIDPNRQSFLATHPATPKRSKRTRERAAELARGPGQPIAGTRSTFYARLDGLVIGTRASEGVFEGAEFLHPDLGFVVAFPRGAEDEWQYVNTPVAVGAARRDESAAALLEVVADGSDALGVARNFEPESGSLDGPPAAARVNGLPAARASASAGWGSNALRADLWWIALGNRVYQLTFVAKKASFDALAETFEDSARSFRRLVDSDRPRITEARLRVQEAESGQTLAALVDGVPSGWSVEAAAVANALEAETPLASGRSVKLAVKEEYGSRGRR